MRWVERLLLRMFRHEDILGSDGSLYMRRWRVLGYQAWLPSLFGLNLMVHRIVRPDEDREPHDHPWWFVSLLVAGWYVEERTWNGPSVGRMCHWFTRWPASLVFRAATDWHRIAQLDPRGAWTIVLTGRRAHTWGFLADDGSKIPHDQYFAWKLARDGAKFGRVRQ